MDKLYIIVRSDIPPGLMLAQACHAMRAWSHVCPEQDDRWFRTSNNVVCLEVGTEGELLDMVKRAVCDDVPHAVFREPDMGGEATAAAFGPEMKRHAGALPLAMKPHKLRAA